MRRCFWQDAGVITFLAIASQAGTGFDWSILAAPSGVILGALIAGFVATRNAKKSVYERLASLMDVCKDWPEGMDGADTVDRSIALALAEIRRREKHTDASVTPSEQRADREVTVSARRDTRVAAIALAGTVIASIIGALGAILTSANSPSATQSSSPWAPILATVVTLSVAGFATFIATRRR